jgi:hypothetical protein
MKSVALLAMSAMSAISAAGCTSSDGVSGHACIVFDLRNPGRCGEMQDVGGLHVVEVSSGHDATTDGDGEFRIALPEGAMPGVLRVADNRTDRRISLVDVASAPSGDVLAPVIATQLWQVYLDALHVTEDPTRATIHIALAGMGEIVGGAGAAGATQVLYNQGDSFIWNALPPGDQTRAVLLIGVPVDTGSATVSLTSRADKVLFDGPVPVQAGAITWLAVEP